MSLVDDVQRYLVTQNIGTDPSNRQTWPIYKYFLPDDDLSQNRAMMVTEVPGRDGPAGKWNVLYSRIVVYVRGDKDFDTEAARQKIWDAFNALQATTAEAGSTLRSILAVDSAPIPLGIDTKKRPMFSWALDVIYQP